MEKAQDLKQYEVLIVAPPHISDIARNENRENNIMVYLRREFNGTDIKPIIIFRKGSKKTNAYVFICFLTPENVGYLNNRDDVLSVKLTEWQIERNRLAGRNRNIVAKYDM
jgi:hypothetical protein